MTTTDRPVGVVGYGEVGRSLAVALATAGHEVAAYEVRWEGAPPDGEPDPGVTACTDLAALGPCEVIFVCVPASAIEVVAGGLADHLDPRTLVVDLASATADSKRRASLALGPDADGYVDVALSAPPLHDGLSARMYASGPRARDLVLWSDRHGMDIRFLGERVGQATQLKILRATLTKGLEAILLESMTTALAYDVDPETVLRTVESAFDDRPFQRFCEYLVSTGVVHDGRRAIEVGEAAEMAEAAGIQSDMARAAQRVLTRSHGLHRAEDEQTFRSALEAYARHARPGSVPVDADLSVRGIPTSAPG